MKYDFSIVINKKIREDINSVQKYFKKKKISSMISEILNIMYPYLKKYHELVVDGLPIYENISWDKKIHICIDYKVYLIIKKIYDDSNGYSMAYVIRRIIGYFVENITKFDNIGDFMFWIKKNCNKKHKIIRKKQYNVWKIMRDRGLKKMGCLLWDGKKREFSLTQPYLSVKHNKYLRNIQFSYY